MKISIIGAGKLGADIFNYLLNYNYTLSLICKNEEIAAIVKNKTEKKINRLRKSGLINQIEYEKKLIDIIVGADLKYVENSNIIIEAISEDLTRKNELFNELEKVLNDDCIICSNSSSFLPAELSQNKEWQNRFIGLHFFYPLKLKSIVEIVKNKKTDPDIISRIKDFLENINKKPLELDEKNAFILNKIYLDIQALAYNLCTENNLEFKIFDDIIKETLFPIGVFEFIDSVGPNIMLTSITNYITFYENKEFYRPLVNKLEELVSNNSTFYSQTTTDIKIYDYNKSLIINKILYTLINSSYKAADNKIVSFEQIDYSMKEYLDIEKGPIELSKEIGLLKIHNSLLDFYNESNNEIFSSSKLLKT